MGNRDVIHKYTDPLKVRVGVPPVPWTVKGLGFKLCIVGVAGSVLDISSSRS